MKVEIREDSVLITGYVNAVERLSKPIRENLYGKVRTFLERIRAGAFRNALKRNDNVLVLLNHDENRVLACTQDGTAILEEDNIGLRAEITITDEEVVEKAREGKLSGWSFGFYSVKDEMGMDGDNETRTVEELDLEEVSILDDTKSPAYYGTSIEARGEDMKKLEIREESFEQEEKEEGFTLEEVANALAPMLADMVASKVLEALAPPEEMAEEEPKEEEPVEEEEPTEDDEPEEDKRSFDYSKFEERLKLLKK